MPFRARSTLRRNSSSIEAVLKHAAASNEATSVYLEGYDNHDGDRRPYVAGWRQRRANNPNQYVRFAPRLYKMAGKWLTKLGLRTRKDLDPFQLPSSDIA